MYYEIFFLLMKLCVFFELLFSIRQTFDRISVFSQISCDSRSFLARLIKKPFTKPSFPNTFENVNKSVEAVVSP